MVSLQLEEMLRVPAVGFLSFTRVRFTGDAQLKMLTETGVQSLKFSISTERGATVPGEKIELRRLPFNISKKKTINKKVKQTKWQQNCIIVSSLFKNTAASCT